MTMGSSSAGLASAVFLDRDGTIIEDRGHLDHPSQVTFFPETLDALRRLQAHYLLFIVTNQSGIGEGILRHAEVDEVNAHVVHHLEQAGIEIRGVYVCPHTRFEECDCRKPNPYFLEQAAAEHGLDLRRSYSIGDHPHDAELARNTGGQGVYVLTGHGKKHRSELAGETTVVQGIADAAEWILGQLTRKGQVCGSSRTPKGIGPGLTRAHTCTSGPS